MSAAWSSTSDGTGSVRLSVAFSEFTVRTAFHGSEAGQNQGEDRAACIAVLVLIYTSPQCVGVCVRMRKL